MNACSSDYELYIRFTEAYASCGYQGIDRNDRLILELEELTRQNNQFFFLGDVLDARIIWTSERCYEMTGIKPENLCGYNFVEATHPEDLEKHFLGRKKMFSLGNDLFIAEHGRALLSTNIRIRNSYGEFPDLFFQLYFFYSTIPYKSTFLLTVLTNIDSLSKRKHGYHYYVGNNLANFRFPDAELLAMGNPYSEREFEIIRMIAAGMKSEQIADKKFLSIHTVNTHRRNILSKAGKETIGEVIVDLMNMGML